MQKFKNNERNKKMTIKEKALIQALKAITHSDSETYYIIWKYAPQLLPGGENIKTFEDLKNTYKISQTVTNRVLKGRYTKKMFKTVLNIF